jgi:membrane protease YdiL (CAAX protease family)
MGETMNDAVNKKKVLSFLGLTFLVDWLLAGLMYLSGGKLNTTGGLAMSIAYMFVPMIMAIVVTKLIYHEPIKEPLGISFRPNRWWLAAWLIPPAISLGAFGVALLFPHVTYSPEMAGIYEHFGKVFTPEQVDRIRKQQELFPIHPFWLAVAQGLIVGPTLNALFAFGEELGWRGFLQKELGPLGFMRASALIGLIWGVWHAPIILMGHNFPDHPVAGAFLWTVNCVNLGIVFSYVRVRARSVIAAAVMHGTYNATWAVSIILLAGIDDLVTGLQGIAGMIATASVAVLLLAFDRFVSKEPIAGGGRRRPAP